MTDDEIRDVFMVAYTPITEGKSADDDAATVAALRVGLRAVARAARAAARREAAEVCADMAEDGRSAQLEGYTVSSDAIRAHEMCADALRARAESEAWHG